MAKRRRHSRRKRRRGSFVRSLKIYSSIFGACFAVAAIISYASGTLPGFFNRTISNAITNQIANQVGDIGGVESGAAKAIIEEKLGEDKNSKDLKKLKKGDMQEMLKQYLKQKR